MELCLCLAGLGPVSGGRPLCAGPLLVYPLPRSLPPSPEPTLPGKSGKPSLRLGAGSQRRLSLRCPQPSQQLLHGQGASLSCHPRLIAFPDGKQRRHRSRGRLEATEAGSGRSGWAGPAKQAFSLAQVPPPPFDSSSCRTASVGSPAVGAQLTAGQLPAAPAPVSSPGEVRGFVAPGLGFDVDSR